MTQTDTFRRVDALINRTLRRHGLVDLGSYTPPGVGAVTVNDIDVIVDNGVQVIDDVGQIIGTRTEIGLLREQVPNPKQGGTVVVGTDTYELEAKAEGSDESRSRWVVKRG